MLRLPSKITFSKKRLLLGAFLTLMIVIVGSIPFINYYTSQSRSLSSSQNRQDELQQKLTELGKELETFKSEDQYQRNQKLELEITNIKKNYSKSSELYTSIIDLRDQKQKTDKLEDAYAKIVKDLSDRNYASAEASLKKLEEDLQKQKTALAASQPSGGGQTSQSPPTTTTPPGSGYQRVGANSDVGAFTVDMVAGDLNSTRVIVDTASGSDCANDCPVLSLGDYVSRNGAIAGINGSYFCPASYPQCAGKTNSYDTLLMNKSKTYFNSANNVYSQVPAVIISGNSARFVSRSADWGRDTGVEMVLANHPLMVLNGQVVFGGNSDPKQGSKGPRSFIASKGSTVYIGVVYNATVGEAAHALKSLGLDNALNLDSGGSTALWANGRYLAGPGRAIPNAILFVRK